MPRMLKCDFGIILEQRWYSAYLTKSRVTITQSQSHSYDQDMLHSSLSGCWKNVTSSTDTPFATYVIQMRSSLHPSTRGGGGTPLYKLYRCVPLHRVGFLRRFGLKTGIHFAHFVLESGMVFEGTTGRSV